MPLHSQTRYPGAYTTIDDGGTPWVKTGAGVVHDASDTTSKLVASCPGGVGTRHVYLSKFGFTLPPTAIPTNSYGVIGDWDITTTWSNFQWQSADEYYHVAANAFGTTNFGSAFIDTPPPQDPFGISLYTGLSIPPVNITALPVTAINADDTTLELYIYPNGGASSVVTLQTVALTIWYVVPDPPILITTSRILR